MVVIVQWSQHLPHSSWTCYTGVLSIAALGIAPSSEPDNQYKLRYFLGLFLSFKSYYRLSCGALQRRLAVEQNAKCSRR